MLTIRLFFFFNDTATTEIYTLSLHDALPIYALHAAQRGGSDLREPREPALRLQQVFHLIEEPRVDARRLRDLLHRQPGHEGALDLEHPLRGRDPQRHAQIVGGVARQAVVGGRGAGDPSRAADLQRAQSLLERLLERA